MWALIKQNANSYYKKKLKQVVYDLFFKLCCVALSSVVLCCLVFFLSVDVSWMIKSCVSHMHTFVRGSFTMQ